MPVGALRHPVLFVNPRSGGGKAQRARLVDRARERGIEAVTLRPGADLATLVDTVVADGADALGVAGGDGSLALVAAVAAARDLPFVCIPAGTRNHFARDVGVAPNDLVGALEAFGQGTERTIDMGYVNERPFLNNVSLGVYGEAVRREGYRDAKLRTLIETAEEVRGPSSAADFSVVDDRGREHRSPAMVLVSNNPYSFARPAVRGARPRLDSGLLGVVVVDPPGPPHLAARAWAAPWLRVEAPGAVAAGIDGEAVSAVPPLTFGVRSKALRVRIAARHLTQRA